MGRPRKLQMVKREEEAARAVTFSKRRHGLMSKTSELCILGKSRVAAIVQSSRCRNKIYSFGFPSTSSVFNAFLTGSIPAETHVEEEARKEMGCLWEENKKLQIEVDCLKEKKDEQFASGIRSFLMSGPSREQLVICYEQIKDLIGKADNKLQVLSFMESPAPALTVLDNRSSNGDSYPPCSVSSNSGDTTWNPFNTFAAGNTYSNYNNGFFLAGNTFDNHTFVGHPDGDVTEDVGGNSFLYNYGVTPDFSLNVGTPSNYQCNFVTPQPQLPNLDSQFYPN